MSDEVIAKFEKNKKEEVRVVLSEFHSRKIFHIRVYYMEDGEWKPGKGLALSVELYKNLAGAILELGEHLSEIGLLSDETDF